MIWPHGGKLINKQQVMSKKKLLKALDKQRAKTIAKEKADKAEAIAKNQKRKPKTAKVVINSGENA